MKKNIKKKLLEENEKRVQKMREEILDFIHTTDDALALYELYLLILDAYAKEHGGESTK